MLNELVAELYSIPQNWGQRDHPILIPEAIYAEESKHAGEIQKNLGICLNSATCLLMYNLYGTGFYSVTKALVFRHGL